MASAITFGLGLLQATDDATDFRIGALFLVIVGIVIYFIPSMVASRKKNASAIIALNFFLGWTLVGWVVALVWSLTHEEKQAAPLPQPVAPVAPVLCTSCGKYAAGNATFCQSCGVALKAS